jgi:hypothetical protein
MSLLRVEPLGIGHSDDRRLERDEQPGHRLGVVPGGDRR